MYLAETAEQQAVRAEMRAYFAHLLRDEPRFGEREGPEASASYRRVMRRLGKDGWLGLGWPTE